MAILVTGALGGIGAAIVGELRDADRDVIAVDQRAGEQSPGVRWLAGDLSTAQGVATAVSALGGEPLDAAIIAHGIDASGAIETLDEALIDRSLRINGASVMWLFDALREQLGRTGGPFVAISSQAGLVGEPKLSAYCAPKFAVVGWAKAMAGRCADVPIRILCPGCTETELLLGGQRVRAEQRGVSFEEHMSELMSTIPVGCLAEPRQTAAAAVYLATAQHAPTILAATGGQVLY